MTLVSTPLPLFGAPSMREVCVPVATVWTSPEAPRDVDAAAVRDLPDAEAWAGSMDADLRLALHGRTETQLLMGEPALVLEERGDWTRMAALWQESSRHRTGYPGWVRTSHLALPVLRLTGSVATVVTPSATCRIDGADVALSFGTVLLVESATGDAATVLLPGDRRGELPVQNLRLGSEERAPRFAPGDLLDVARQFIGVRYLWGGTSAWGLDCSGLVHLAMRSLGVVLARDAHDQAVHHRVRPVPLDAVAPGDLYFFARPGQQVFHVGFATAPVADDGTRWMLHAPEGGELIEDGPLADHRVETLVAAGRVSPG